MDNNNLKNLLIKYEEKRNTAEQLAKNNKDKLFLDYPYLLELDNKINNLSIKKLNCILLNNKNDLEKIKNDLNNLIIEKNIFIKKNNINLLNTKPIYECNICKDTGYVINKDNSSTMCNCLKQKLFNLEYNKSNISNIQRENFNTFSLDFYSKEINKEKYNSNESPYNNIKKIKNICDNFINNFDNPNEPNLLFTGNTGLGKTFLCNCIAKEMLSKEKTVLYQTSPVMLDEIISYRFGNSNISFDVINQILNVDLLIIDDLGTEVLNDRSLAELFNIINSRIINQNNKITKTIISTNLDIKELYNNYSERICSRLIGHYNICRFFGDDIRIIKKIK